MPTTPDGIEIYLQEKILYGVGKAANAGGVAVSGLEMSQNSLRYSWTREEVDNKLQGIMKAIHEQCVEQGKQGKFINYVDGANIAGFIKVADAMLAYGVIQALDGNLLVPILFSEAVNLHPVAIIVAILVFGGIWGVLGVFFAIPLATLVKAVLTAWPTEPPEEQTAKT